MTSSQIVPPLPSTPAITVPVPLVADLSDFERLAFLKTIAELADLIQSTIVKGWLQSDLRAPK